MKQKTIGERNGNEEVQNTVATVDDKIKERIRKRDSSLNLDETEEEVKVDLRRQTSQSSPNPINIVNIREQLKLEGHSNS